MRTGRRRPPRHPRRCAAQSPWRRSAWIDTVRECTHSGESSPQRWKRRCGDSTRSLGGGARSSDTRLPDESGVRSTSQPSPSMRRPWPQLVERLRRYLGANSRLRFHSRPLRFRAGVAGGREIPDAVSEIAAVIARLSGLPPRDPSPIETDLDLPCRRPCRTPSAPTSTPSHPTSPAPFSRPSEAPASTSSSRGAAEHLDVVPVALGDHQRRRRPRLPARRLPPPRRPRVVVLRAARPPTSRRRSARSSRS